jgi:hypothetical protein
MAGQEGADGLKLAHARHHLACGADFEIAHRQVEQMRKQPLAELGIDTIGRMRQHIGAPVGSRLVVTVLPSALVVVTNL